MKQPFNNSLIVVAAKAAVASLERAGVWGNEEMEVLQAMLKFAEISESDAACYAAIRRDYNVKKDGERLHESERLALRQEAVALQLKWDKMKKKKGLSEPPPEIIAERDRIWARGALFDRREGPD
jgi:hypothetical protein